MKIIEIGHNHLGSRARATALVTKVLDSEADALTLQIREREFYLENPQYALDPEFLTQTRIRSHSAGKSFGVALSDLSLLSLCEQLSVDFYKILSRDLENSEFLSNFRTDKKLYLSTGMSPLEAIDAAVDIVGKDNTLIHTSLSDNLEDMNIKAIQTMQEYFNMPIAYGNHCKDINATFAALAFNPSDIFLYLKVADGTPCPDDAHAVTARNLDSFLKSICDVEKTIGNGVKCKLTDGIRGQK